MCVIVWFSWAELGCEGKLLSVVLGLKELSAGFGETKRTKWKISLELIFALVSKVHVVLITILPNVCFILFHCGESFVQMIATQICHTRLKCLKGSQRQFWSSFGAAVCRSKVCNGSGSNKQCMLLKCVASLYKVYCFWMQCLHTLHILLRLWIWVLCQPLSHNYK